MAKMPSTGDHPKLKNIPSVDPSDMTNKVHQISDKHKMDNVLKKESPAGPTGVLDQQKPTG